VTRSSGAALSRCVSCGPDRFAGDYWGRQPLLTPAAGDYADLFSPAAVDDLIARHGLRTPFIRMAKDGSVIPAARFTRPGGAGAAIADQVADDRVLALMAGGATLVLQALHRTWPPLIDFGVTLASELGHPVQINAYVTPPQNQGFAPHYDVHDVFVLQIAGHKRWVIHEPVLPDPLPDQPWEQRKAEVAARAAQDPLIDTVLRPGDALYLPRGTIHSATALGETSIHLTVGVHPVTRHHLVQQLLAASADDVELRRSLPMGVDLADPDVLGGELAETVKALAAHLDSVDTARAAEHIRRHLEAQTRPAPLGPLAQLDAVRGLTPDTRVRLRDGLRPRFDADALVLPDRRVAVSARILDAIASGEPFTAGDDVDLVAELLTAGVLIPA
jgi:ribosomal protein L16 Arg81 hydroxylase